MVIRSTVAGVAGVMMMMAAGSNPASAQGSCPVGCDGAVNWTGFSIGVGIGGNADIIGHDYVVTNDATGAYNSSGLDDGRGGAGFFGSVGIGYDWQVRDRFVIGAFTDFDFGKSDHREADTFALGGGSFKTAGWDIERNTTWTIGARLGLLTTNTSMLYGLIGYSRTDMDVSVFTEIDGTSIPTRPISRNLEFSGLVLGAGMEHSFGNGFSLKGEYRYTNYGSEYFGKNQEVTDLGVATGQSEADTFDLDSHSFRLTVAYKFDRGEAVEEVSYKDVAPAPAYGSRYK
ncbi:MAG: outer membrane beta-barrel protein [Hyphomicrobiaceae bacterium]|nr:outer membrane beta-barrel protein [Hyphomicrobiaceae bacterium]